jgi:cytochrome b561
MNNNSIGPSSSQQYYDSVARFFHWAVLALLVVEFSIAWTMPEVHKDTRPDGLISWHLFFGTLIFAVTLTRMLWRLFHNAPPDVAMPRWQALLANTTHKLLYVVLIVLPLMGWANASSRGWDVKLLGSIPLPALAPRGSDWGHEMGDVHQAVAIGLLAIIGLHVAAAIYHQWVMRDNLLQRMLPRKQ